MVRAQQVHRPDVHGRGCRPGHLDPVQPADRRDSGPFGHPGHRVLALGPLARHHRRPGHLPDHDGPARRAQGKSDPRLFGLRVFIRLHHLRRRHRYLLGAQPRARIPEQSHSFAAARREDGDRAGRHRCRLGVSVRAGGRKRAAQPGRPALFSGLEPALRACNPCPVWPKWRRSADFRSSTR